jgi:hypothetical protein
MHTAAAPLPNTLLTHRLAPRGRRGFAGQISSGAWVGRASGHSPLPQRLAHRPSIPQCVRCELRHGGAILRSSKYLAAKNSTKRGGIIMRAYSRRLSAAILLSGMIASTVNAEERDNARNHGPVYNVAHFDVIPVTIGGIDFLQNAYSLLFKYRDQSNTDAGLRSFRILNLVPPATNHSEIVQVWSSYDAYKDHLAKSHTVGFRFDVQGNPALGGICCVGSPIDDRQYRLV